MKSLTLTTSFPAHSSNDIIYRIKQSPFNQNYVVTCSSDRKVKVWQTPDWNLVRSYTGHTSYVHSFEFINTDTMGSGERDGIIHVWSISTGRRQISILVFDRVFCLKILSNGFHLAAGVYSGNIQIYNINDGSLVASLIGQTWGASELVLMSSNLLASSSGVDGTTRIWDLANNYTSKLVINQGSDHLVKISCSVLATTPGDYTIKLWDIESGQLVKVLLGHSSNIYLHSYDVLKYGQTLVSGSWDQTIRIWDLNTGQCLNTINTPKYVVALAIVNRNLTGDL